MSHPGIELQVSVPAGVIMQMNSDMIHLTSRLRGGDDQGWSELLTTIEGLSIRARAVELPDLVDVDQDDDPEPEPGLYACYGCGWRFERRTAAASLWTGPMWGDRFGRQHGRRDYSWEQLTEDHGDCVGQLRKVDEGRTAVRLAELLETVLDTFTDRNALPGKVWACSTVKDVDRWREELQRLRP